MECNTDFGLAVDWKQYTPFTRFLCLTPIINLFFTETFMVEATLLDAVPHPISIFAYLRFPKSPKMGVYRMTCCFKGFCNFAGSAETTQVSIELHRGSKIVGRCIHPIRKEDANDWFPYYCQKSEHRTKINFGDVEGGKCGN